MDQLYLDNNMFVDNSNINTFANGFMKLNYNLWQNLEGIKWYEKSKKYGKDANEKVAEHLKENYLLDDVIVLKNFAVEKRKALQHTLIGYFKASPTCVRKEFTLSDDGLWDLTAHIVGMGEVMYTYVYDHPEIVLLMQKDYQENFEYGFDVAIYDLNNYDDNNLVS